MPALTLDVILVCPIKPRRSGLLAVGFFHEVRGAMTGNHLMRGEKIVEMGVIDYGVSMDAILSDTNPNSSGAISGMGKTNPRQ
jgi:hypothetical protein